jgi:hypothetical protein
MYREEIFKIDGMHKKQNKTKKEVKVTIPENRQ